MIRPGEPLDSSNGSGVRPAKPCLAFPLLLPWSTLRVFAVHIPQEGQRWPQELQRRRTCRFSSFGLEQQEENDDRKDEPGAQARRASAGKAGPKGRQKTGVGRPPRPDRRNADRQQRVSRPERGPGLRQHADGLSLERYGSLFSCRTPCGPLRPRSTRRRQKGGGA